MKATKTTAPLREMTLAMARLRRLDERLVVLQRQGRIGFWGSALGEEAAVIGSAAALNAGDWIVPALRQGGALLWRGYPLELMLAQAYGSSSDPSHGRQMPDHAASAKYRQVSWSSCIGNQIPHGVGIAFAMKRAAKGEVCLTYFGDGATSEADFHCAMTFAGVWKVPCVLVCQNNQWAISVPVTAQSREPNISKKAQAYGFSGVRVDGNDIEAVFVATQRAIANARAGKGATLVELLTNRIGAHSTSDDPNVYRDEAATQKWFATHDPLPRALKRCEEEGALTRAELDANLAAWDKQFEACVKKLEADQPPEKATLFTDVYAKQPWHLEEEAANANL